MAEIYRDNATGQAKSSHTNWALIALLAVIVIALIIAITQWS